MNTQTVTAASIETDDANLVAQTLQGDRDAFARIVARYQNLICSVNYCATGSVSQSEDVAQETFLTAWQELPKLREPAKLRPWLCRIARNLTYDARKKAGREPSHAASTLESAETAAAPCPSPNAEAVSREEEELLWRSLAQIPELYREPLVLFYREQESIRAVAEQLDLTEDAVKQRLARGRKLLQEQVQSFVEGTLRRTSPGKIFTIGVLAALPGFTISAKAAAIGATAVKGSATAKAAAVTGVIGSVLAPLMGFFGLWAGYRMGQDTARTPRERQFNQSFYARLIAVILGFFVVFFIVLTGGKRLMQRTPVGFAGLIGGIGIIYFALMVALSIWCYRARKRMLAARLPEEIKAAPLIPLWEYRSRLTFLGLPLIHFRVGDRMGEPLRAWIAAGDCAIGGLFAFGGLAIAPISIGGCAVGLLSFGGVSLALLAIGGLAMGLCAYGGLAMGWQAFGGCALARDAAWGGYAVAHRFALGGVVHAAQSNNSVAESYINAQAFFKFARALYPHKFWPNLIWAGPMMVQWFIVSRKRRQSTAAI